MGQVGHLTYGLATGKDRNLFEADQIREAAIESKQLQIEIDEPEEDQMAVLMGSETTDDSPEEDISEENLLRALMEAQESK